MIAVLVLLGVGLAMSALASSYDAADIIDAYRDRVDDEEPTETGSGTQTYSDGSDFIVSQDYQAGHDAALDLFVEEGELTQAQADIVNDNFEFPAGPLDIATGGGIDAVVGSAGDDRIGAGGGDDIVHGGAGDDLIKLAGGDDVAGVDGHAAPREDDIQLFPVNYEPTAPESELEGGDDTITGGAGNDAIADGYGSNVLSGGLGHDFIVATDQDEGAPDTVSGGWGRDVIFVDEGDTVETGGMADRVIVELIGDRDESFDVVTITDFNPEEDRLMLEGAWSDFFYRDPSSPDDDTTTRTTIDDLEDGTGVIISIAGIPVVHVVGGQGMTLSDIAFST